MRKRSGLVKRAYAAEDKHARRQVILETATRLFMAARGALPAMEEIALAAGLAKGTVYLYFRTKGEIFAAVLEEGWGEALDRLTQAFQPDTDARQLKIDRFLARVVEHTVRYPELMELDALGPCVLERNMDLNALIASKQTMLARLTAGGTLLDHSLALPAGRGVQLLVRTYALTRGLWQSFYSASHSGAVLPTPYRLDFPIELRQALEEYWRGALAP